MGSLSLPHFGERKELGDWKDGIDLSSNIDGRSGGHFIVHKMNWNDEQRMFGRGRPFLLIGERSIYFIILYFILFFNNHIIP